MDTRSRTGEDLRSNRLSKAYLRSVHTRRTKRAASAARGGSSTVLRAATTPARDRRDADSRGDGSSKAVDGGGRTGGRQYVEGGSEGESGASTGHG